MNNILLAQLNILNHFDEKLNFMTGFNAVNILTDAFNNGYRVTAKEIHLLYCHIYLMDERIKYIFKIFLPLKEKGIEQRFPYTKHGNNLVKLHRS
ncbi:hypothetical protein [Clostridium beijerinckii]|uniref:hypothetical protein n=1 Tax=Clostridium beijerinckii TaxID=1520 RepID=UPI0022E71AA7|nr:hypothetical protein [Clostridium beijerinckii]